MGACDAVMRAHRHHSTPMRTLLIECVELTLQVGSVSVGAEMARFKVHNVVHVKRIRDNSKWFVTNMVGFDWIMRLTGRSDI